MTYSGSPDPDPGIVKRDEETLQRQREEKAEQDRLEEERRILEQEVPYWQRERDFKQNPPLDNLEYNLGIESKQFQGRQLIGSRFFDTVESGVETGMDWLRQQAQEDPDRYSDDMLRLLGGGLQNTAWAISKLPLINEIAKGEDWLAEQARGMSEHLTPFLDPRFAGWGARIATGILADKGIGKAVKGSKFVTKAALSSIDDLKDATTGYAHAFGYGFGGGTGGAFSTGGRVTRIIPDNVATEMMRSGLKDGYFDLDTWQRFGFNRKAMEVLQTDPAKMVQIRGKNSIRTLLIDETLEEFGPYLELTGAKPGSINLHHIFGLNLSAPLYQGIGFNTPELTALNEVLKKYNVIPGNTKENLMMALKEPHDILHHQYFRDKFIQDTKKGGKKFFNAKRMKKITGSEAGRLEVAEEYAKIVKEGEVLIKRAMDQIQNVFGETDIPSERLVDAFSESLTDGTTNLLKDGNYKVPLVNKKVKEMVEQLNKDLELDPYLSKPEPKQVPKVKSKTVKEQDLGRLADLREDLNAKGKTKKQKDLDLAEIAELEAKYEAKQEGLFNPKNIRRKK